MNIQRTPRVILEYRDQDPFSNLILRTNKSPVLKPVCVKPRTLLQKSQSDAKILRFSALPPIPLASRFKISLESPIFTNPERLLVRTPSFHPARLRAIKNLSEMKLQKPRY